MRSPLSPLSSPPTRRKSDWRTGNVPIDADMVQLVPQSKYAADTAYYLGKHKAEAATISGMGILGAAVPIKGIGDKVSSPSR